MKKSIITLFLLLAMLCAFSQKATITFSKTGGCYNESFELSLQCDEPDCQIFYTTNGSTPSTDDYLYTTPLMLDQHLYSTSDIYKIPTTAEKDFFIPKDVQKCIVLRCATFDKNGKQISPVATQSYFIKSLGCDFEALPVVSICADSLDLFDYDKGILVPGKYWDPENPDRSGNYYQKGSEWERPINVELYDTDNAGFNQGAGLRTHGGSSRYFQQKGLTLYAKKDYGPKRFDYKVFQDCNLTAFKRLVLKPFRSAWTSAGIQDYLGSHIAQPLGQDVLASRPAILFINGEYWGIYFLEEKHDQHYLADHYDGDSDDYNIMEGWYGTVDEGSPDNFLDLLNWINTQDYIDSAGYDYLCSKIDMANFIDYQIFEIFIKNEDWPANNALCWQEKDGPWRWFCYDHDAGFRNHSFDALANATYTGSKTWPSDIQSTKLFRLLLGYSPFLKTFINRFKELLHSEFQYNNTVPHLERVTTLIDGQINAQCARFNFPKSLNSWNNSIKNIDNFLKNRPQAMESELENFFLISNSISNIILYPNPTIGTFKVDFDTPNLGICKIMIYDLSGNCCYTSYAYSDGTHFSTELHPQLSPGLYIVKVGNQTKKIVFLQPK